MNEKVVNAALLGLGTVGTGVYKVIKSQEQEMTAKLGCQVKITKILVRNLEKASGKVDDPSVLTTDWADIEGDPSIPDSQAYTFTIKDESLEVILRIMSRINPISYMFDGNDHVKITHVEPSKK